MKYSTDSNMQRTESSLEKVFLVPSSAWVCKKWGQNCKRKNVQYFQKLVLMMLLVFLAYFTGDFDDSKQVTVPFALTASALISPSSSTSRISVAAGVGIGTRSSCCSNNHNGGSTCTRNVSLNACFGVPKRNEAIIGSRLLSSSRRINKTQHFSGRYSYGYHNHNSCSLQSLGMTNKNQKHSNHDENTSNEKRKVQKKKKKKSIFPTSNILNIANTNIPPSQTFYLQLSSSLSPHNNSHKNHQNRRFFFSSLLLLMSSSSTLGLLSPLSAYADEITWSPSPINKRSGITVFKAEETYNIQFITYLARFLLSFDEECQKWWYRRAADIPKTASLEQVNMIRLKQFGSFAASVEVGLQEFEGTIGTNDGPKGLMASLLNRYGSDFEEIKANREQRGLSPYKPFEEERIRGEIKEARRQIALLFGLLKTSQPVEEITKLLAAIDNASVRRIDIVSHGSGYAPGYGVPAVTFPSPDAGEGYETATGRAKLRANGQILRIDLQQRGFGFTKPPTVEILQPLAAEYGSPMAKAATAKAFIFRDGVNKGRVERIELTSSGSGYTEDEPIKIYISPPDLNLEDGGQKCVAEAILEYEVDSIEIINPGTGYASEKPVLIEVDPPPLTARVNLNDPMVVKRLSLDDSSKISLNSSKDMKASNVNVIYDPSTLKSKAWKMAKIGGGGGCVGRACYDNPVVAYAYPFAESNSYSSFRQNEGSTSNFNSTNDNGEKISAASGGNDSFRPQLPFFSSSSSSSLLSLLPTGIGLSFNTELNRYELVASKDAMLNTEMTTITPGKPIDTGKKEKEKIFLYAK